MGFFRFFVNFLFWIRSKKGRLEEQHSGLPQWASGHRQGNVRAAGDDQGRCAGVGTSANDGVKVRQIRSTIGPHLHSDFKLMSIFSC